MGLRATIKAAVRSGFKALGDIPVEVEFRELTGDAIYNTTTGDVTETYNSFTVEEAVFTNLTKKDLSRLSEKATGITPTDKKLLILAEDLQTSYIEAGGATVINPVDVETFYYVLVGLVKYLILQVEQDPSETLWTLVVRKP